MGSRIQRFPKKREYKMCDGKRKFKSSEAGKLGGLIKQRKYECPICGHWHLTSKGTK